MNVNVNGVLYTAQAAGRQMRRFGSGGSIILIASMSGSITNQVSHIIARVQCTHLLRSLQGTLLGIIQHFQVRRASDGAQHGLRARQGEDPGQHSEPRIYLYEVSYVIFYRA